LLTEEPTINLDLGAVMVIPEPFPDDIVRSPEKSYNR
jgi:hypothetical protein